jgi:hypothetical protein
MEHRFDLENILLNGLPEKERRHVVKVMRHVTEKKLQRLKAEGVRGNDPIDITDLSRYEDEDY